MRKGIVVGGVVVVLLLAGSAGVLAKENVKPTTWNKPNPVKSPQIFWVNGKEKDAEIEMVDGEKYVPLKLLHELAGVTVDESYEDGSIGIKVPYEMVDATVGIKYIDQMQTLTVECGGNDVVPNFTDNMGGTYGFGSLAVDSNGYDATYFLGGKYKSLKGKLVPSADWSQMKTNNDIGRLDVITDGKTVYTSGAVHSDITKPIDVNVDLTGVNKVEIRVSNVPEKYVFSKLDPKLGFANVEFVAK